MPKKKDPIPPADQPTTEPDEWSLSERLKAHEMVDVRRFAKTRGDLVEAQKIEEIAALLWLPEGISVELRDAKIVKAMDLFEGIKPTEGIEAMLAMQMVGTHHAAMECMRRAMSPGQTFEGRDANLNNAQRLMGLYTQQMTALAKHRGKGQQRITVERVEVAAGGQAIVGNVGAEAMQASAAAASMPAQPALEAPREDMVPLPAMAVRDKVKR